jgi:uncharacterized protein
MADVIEANMEAIRELCQQFGVARLELFGSAASGQLREESDLDFLVTFKAMGSREHCDGFFGLLFGLERVTGRKVDLLEVDAIENPFLLAEVQASKRGLYAA